MLIGREKVCLHRLSECWHQERFERSTEAITDSCLFRGYWSGLPRPYFRMTWHAATSHFVKAIIQTSLAADKIIPPTRQDVVRYQLPDHRPRVTSYSVSPGSARCSRFRQPLPPETLWSRTRRGAVYDGRSLTAEYETMMSRLSSIQRKCGLPFYIDFFDKKIILQYLPLWSNLNVDF